MTYQIEEMHPSVEEFVFLRKITGLSPRSIQAAEKGLPNSLFAITVRLDDHVVGMGRVIGDGGCNYEIVDMAVHPDHQGRRLGKQIMEALMSYIHENAPSSAYVSLVADVEGFYEEFGFKSVRPKSDGMYFIVD